MSLGALTRDDSLGYFLGAGTGPYGIYSYGNNVYAICSGIGAAAGIAQLAFDASGKLGLIGGNKPLMVATANGPRRMHIMDGGLRAYVAVTGYGKIQGFNRAADGSMTSINGVNGATDIGGLNGPEHIRTTKNGKFLYCTDFSGNQGDTSRILVYKITASNGNLVAGTHLSLPYAFGLEIGPNDDVLYVSRKGGPNTIEAYTIDQTTGNLTLVSGSSTSMPSGGAWPNTMKLTTDGTRLYTVTDSGTNYTLGFARDIVTHLLSPLGYAQLQAPENTNGLWDVALSKDAGQTSLYVACSDGMKVAQYDRSDTAVSNNGGLTGKSPVSVKTSNWTASPSGSSYGPDGITVSDDNKWLFATATQGNTVDVFAIEQPAATTTPVFRDFVGTFDVLNRVSRDFVGTFDVLQRVSRDFIGTFDVLGATESLASLSVPAARTAVFSSRSRIVVFDGDAPVSRQKGPLDELYFVGDFTKDTSEAATAPQSVAPVSTGVAVLEGPVLQNGFGVVKLGALDMSPNAKNTFTFRVTLANNEQVDRTIELTPFDDRTKVFGKDPDDKRLYSWDFSADAAFSGSPLESVQPPVPVGVSALSGAAISGNVAKVMIGGLNAADGAVNSCTLTAFLANTEKLVRSIYFRKEEH